MTIAEVPLTRSQLMARVRGRGNKSTEEKLARLFRKAGITGWRRHLRLPGTPDFAFPKLRFALFVDGCFWHGCPRCYTRPKTNRAFWDKKLRDNRARDRKVTRELRDQGWSVLRIWSHSLRRDEMAVLAKIIRVFLTRRQDAQEPTKLPPEFLRTYFIADKRSGGWPDRFAVVTAHNPDGVIVSRAANRVADARLERRLTALGSSPFRVTGGSKDMSHAESGWGFAIANLETAVWLGREFRQLAVFWINRGDLFLLDCNSNVRPLFVAKWKDRAASKS